MGKLDVIRHERVGGHPFRWHVHLRDRSEPVVVELPEEERSSLDLSDEEIHALIPTALERRADETYGEHPDRDVTWDAPVRLFQTHFIG